MVSASARKLALVAALFAMVGYGLERQVEPASAWDYWYGPSTATVWDYDEEDRAQLDFDIFYYDWTFWLSD